MHKSLNKFKPYVEQGLLRQVISPCGKLVLWNYTDKCTYEKAWDEVTLNARGTVYEIETGDIIARAFPKFFNFGELSSEKQQEVLQAKSFETYEKMDGSLGIVYYYDGEWRVNTRGSFTSDQAVKGKEILEDFDTSFLFKQFTYLVEIIYPQNKIIVDYGNECSLYYLGSFCIKVTGEYEVGEDLMMMHSSNIFKRGKNYNFNSISELQSHLETLDHTEEGYVVRLDNGYRVKFKSAEYLKVARVMSNMTPLSLWKVMNNGKVELEYLEALPEEFRHEIDRMVVELENRYSMWYKSLQSQFRNNITILRGDVSRKRIALVCKEKDLNLPAMFAILDGKDNVLNKIIMTEIRPFGNQMEF